MSSGPDERRAGVDEHEQRRRATSGQRKRCDEPAQARVARPSARRRRRGRRRVAAQRRQRVDPGQQLGRGGDEPGAGRRSADRRRRRRPAPCRARSTASSTWCDSAPSPSPSCDGQASRVDLVDDGARRRPARSSGPVSSSRYSSDVCHSSALVPSATMRPPSSTSTRSARRSVDERWAISTVVRAPRRVLERRDGWPPRCGRRSPRWRRRAPAPAGWRGRRGPGRCAGAGRPRA